MDGDAQQADSKQLSKFGEFATIDALALGDVTKYESVLDIDISTVFLKMKYDSAVHQYQKRLYRIKENNARNKSKSRR